MDKIGSQSGQFYMYCNLQDGDLIETGQKPILADVSNYESFFAMCERVASMHKECPRKDFGGGTYRMAEMEANDLGMSPDVVSHIQVFNARLCILNGSDEEFKELARSAKLRLSVPEATKEQDVKPVKLSTLVEEGLAMCSESSILAQAYLQRQGIECYLCDARLFQDRKEGIIHERHHYLAIHDNNEMFVYDPLNTMETGRPRIVKTGMTKNQFIQKAQGKESFIVETKPDKITNRFDVGDPHHLGYGFVAIRNGRNSD